MVDRGRRRGKGQYVIDRSLDVNVVRDVVLDEREAVVAEEVRDVRRAAGDEVVDADHFVAAREKELAEVRAEEAGAARDQGTAHQTRSRTRTSSARPTEW